MQVRWFIVVLLLALSACGEVSRFHDGASAERDHPLFQKVRLSEMVLIDALAA